MPKYYAYHTAEHTGIATEWAAVEPLIKGVSNAQYKRFDTLKDASRYLTEVSGRPFELKNEFHTTIWATIKTQLKKLRK